MSINDHLLIFPLPSSDWTIIISWSFRPVSIDLMLHYVFGKCLSHEVFKLDVIYFPFEVLAGNALFASWCLVNHVLFLILLCPCMKYTDCIGSTFNIQHNTDNIHPPFIERKWRTFLSHSQGGASPPIPPSVLTSLFMMTSLAAHQSWAFPLWPLASRITRRYLAASTRLNLRPSLCSISHSLPVTTPTSTLMLTTPRFLGDMEASMLRHHLRI